MWRLVSYLRTVYWVYWFTLLENFNLTVSNELKPAKSATNYSFKATSEKFTKCFKCMSNHFLHKCFKFKELSARKAFVQKYRLCYNCLSDQHGYRDCISSPHVYFPCKQKHDTMLCGSFQGTVLIAVSEYETPTSTWRKDPIEFVCLVA